jgi:NAD(P)-dependent dehydrogenase (short-subunit alcohol dehydrogenase family)
MSMQGKSVLVTGASGTLGRAMVKSFLDEGAAVTAQCFLHPEALSTLSQLARERGRQLQIEAVDLTDPLAIREMFKRQAQRASGLDVLVNNAGGGKPQSFDEISYEEWSACLQLNLTAPFLCIQQALPLLRQARGCIVNISSVAALTGGSFGPHYTTAKAGLIGLARSAARSFGRDGIRVNTIAPGPVESPMTDSLQQDAIATMLRETALGRVVSPAEVAEAVVWLSTAATAVSGQTLVIDNGRYFL